MSKGTFYITFLIGKHEFRTACKSVKKISIHHPTAVEFWIIYWYVCLFIKIERNWQKYFNIKCGIYWFCLFELIGGHLKVYWKPIYLYKSNMSNIKLFWRLFRLVCFEYHQNIIVWAPQKNVDLYFSGVFAEQNLWFSSLAQK